MWKPKFLDVIDLKNQVRTLKARESDLIITTQALTNALTGLDETDNAHYVGSQYRTYDSQVTALAKKYAGTADWGSLTMKNIIDVRAAFITGSGVVAKVREGVKGDATREMEFIRRFMRMNGIDGKKPQLWGTEAEIEGKVLFRIVPDFDPLDGGGNVKVIHTPWRKYKYTVEAAEPDFEHFIRAYFIDPSKAGFDMMEKYFVFARFGGNPYEVNLTAPKAAFVLRHVEDLDKELWDWRKINHLFAAPTPVFICEDAETARRTEADLQRSNWRIGKAFIGAGVTFELVSYSGEGADSVKEAIESDIQVISGTTGIPVHFLGHPELLSNRSTADALMQHIELSTDKERDIWAAAYTELFRKAVAIFNESFSNNLDPDAVIAELPSASASKLSYIETVYLPMYLAGALSLETLLSYLTDVDLTAEIGRVKAAQAEKEAKEAARLKDERALQNATVAKG